jgi:murein DD-endopeptidase MepM/ murein hydrolase activator NlpD
MPQKHELLRQLIGLILEGDSDKEKNDSDEDEYDNDPGRPRGAREYRSRTGEIVTIPDYVNLPKVSIRWDDDTTKSDDTSTPSRVSRADVRSSNVIADMKQVDSAGSKRYISDKYGVKQSLYGVRQDPIYGDERTHLGLDISRTEGPTEGTTVTATESGTVVFEEGKFRGPNPTDGYGNQVIIKHDDKVTGTRYAHLQSTYVKKGERVSAGGAIGAAGNTGKSTAPHLHFEYITGFDKDDRPIATEDPRVYLNKSGPFYPLAPYVKTGK